MKIYRKISKLALDSVKRSEQKCQLNSSSFFGQENKPQSGNGGGISVHGTISMMRLGTEAIQVFCKVFKSGKLNTFQIRRKLA